MDRGAVRHAVGHSTPRSGPLVPTGSRSCSGSGRSSPGDGGGAPWALDMHVSSASRRLAPRRSGSGRGAAWPSCSSGPPDGGVEHRACARRGQRPVGHEPAGIGRRRRLGSARTLHRTFRRGLHADRHSRALTWCDPARSSTDRGHCFYRGSIFLVARLPLRAGDLDAVTVVARSHLGGAPRRAVQGGLGGACGAGRRCALAARDWCSAGAASDGGAFAGAHARRALRVIRQNVTWRSDEAGLPGLGRDGRRAPVAGVLPTRARRSQDAERVALRGRDPDSLVAGPGPRVVLRPIGGRYTSRRDLRTERTKEPCAA